MGSGISARPPLELKRPVYGDFPKPGLILKELDPARGLREGRTRESGFDSTGQHSLEGHQSREYEAVPIGEKEWKV